MISRARFGGDHLDQEGREVVEVWKRKHVRVPVYGGEEFRGKFALWLRNLCGEFAAGQKLADTRKQEQYHVCFHFIIEDTRQEHGVLPI
jgi:hypothetical protein